MKGREVQYDAQAQSDSCVMDERGEGENIYTDQSRTWFGLACKNGNKEGYDRYEDNLKRLKR